MNQESLIELIQTVSSSNLTQFNYEEGNIKISMEKNAQTVQQVVTTTAAAPVVTTVAAPAPVEAKAEEELEGNIIKSPLVGIFYAAPAEDAEPYVSVGDTVKKGQTLGIVEAMKLMNEIESEFDGTLAEVLVENGQSVEYGQPLFRLK